MPNAIAKCACTVTCAAFTWWIIAASILPVREWLGISQSVVLIFSSSPPSMAFPWLGGDWHTGCGDHRLSDVSFLPDPCPLPDKLKKRSLIDKEKLIYAPMSGVGGIIYDKDSIYIELGGSHSHTAKEVPVYTKWWMNEIPLNFNFIKILGRRIWSENGTHFLHNETARADGRQNVKISGAGLLLRRQDASINCRVRSVSFIDQRQLQPIDPLPVIWSTCILNWSLDKSAGDWLLVGFS